MSACPVRRRGGCRCLIVICRFRGKSSFDICEDLSECFVIAGYSKVGSAVSEQKPGETNEVLREKVTEQDSLPDPAITDSAEFKCALQLLRDAIRGEKAKHSTASLEETTTRGVPVEGD